ncbi:MAG: CoA pyrophosphatase [Alphaproteobacteria bacterium]
MFLPAGRHAMTPDAFRHCLSLIEPDGWNAVSAIDPDSGPLTPAAVLIPLVTHDHGLAAILTERTAHLNDHAGQVSFPGGRHEPDDDGPVATALRETAEEIGLASNCIEIIGCLDAQDTSSGFSVVPVVGLVEPVYSLTLDDFEVDEAFEVPLAFLFDGRNKRREEMIWQGRLRAYEVFNNYQGHKVWGVTARIIGSLQEAIEAKIES